MRAETLPRPYRACSGPGPPVFVVGKASGASSQGSGRMAPAISLALASAGRSRCSGGGVHQQGSHPRRRGRGHAGAVQGDIPAAASASCCRVDTDTGGHDLRRQAPVKRGSVAAEPRDFAAVRRGAHGKGVLGRAVVGKAGDVLVGLRDHVQLAMSPDDGVELARVCSPAGEAPGRGGQTQVDDQGLDGEGGSPLFGTRGRFRQEVHSPKDAFSSPPATAIQHLGKADVPHSGRHAGESWLDVSVAGDGPGDVGPVAVLIDP